MSRRSSASSKHEFSDDSYSGKRAADEARNSAAKRIRSVISRRGPSHDSVGEFIVVSTSNNGHQASSFNTIKTLEPPSIFYGSHPTSHPTSRNVDTIKCTSLSKILNKEEEDIISDEAEKRLTTTGTLDANGRVAEITEDIAVSPEKPGSHPSPNSIYSPIEGDARVLQVSNANSIPKIRPLSCPLESSSTAERHSASHGIKSPIFGPGASYNKVLTSVPPKTPIISSSIGLQNQHKESKVSSLFATEKQERGFPLKPSQPFDSCNDTGNSRSASANSQKTFSIIYKCFETTTSEGKPPTELKTDGELVKQAPDSEPRSSHFLHILLNDQDLAGPITQDLRWQIPKEVPYQFSSSKAAFPPPSIMNPNAPNIHQISFNSSCNTMEPNLTRSELGFLNTYPLNPAISTMGSSQQTHFTLVRSGDGQDMKISLIGGHTRLDSSPNPAPTERKSSTKSSVSRDTPNSVQTRREVPPFHRGPRTVFRDTSPPLLSPNQLPPIQTQNDFTRLTSIQPPQRSATLTTRSSLKQTQNFRPPAVVFTIDNRAQSQLLAVDVQALIQNFTENARVLVPTSNSRDPDGSYHSIGVLMWQAMPYFYKWYSEATGSTETSRLRFEMIDVHWQLERAFLVLDGSLSDFQALKQYIWDFYWTADHLNDTTKQFRVSITPFSPRYVHSQTNSQTQLWNLASPKVSDPPVLNPSRENITVAAEEQEYTTPKRQPLQSSPLAPLPTRSNPGAMKDAHRFYQRRSPLSAPTSSTASNISTRNSGRSSGIEVFKSSGDSAPHPSQYVHDPPGPPVNSTRTSWDKVILRDRVHSFLVGRNELEPLSEESSVHDKLPYKTGLEVCGAVVDMKSGKGLVTLSGKGYLTLKIPTGPDSSGDRYQEISIQPKQTCMLHGDAVVLYYMHQRPVSPKVVESFSSLLQSTHSQNIEGPLANGVEILVRLQINGIGKFSDPFGKSILRPNVTSAEFFSWFSSRTRRGGSQGPRVLKFTFKDAMPNPKTTEVARGNEDHFNSMYMDIKAECEKAKKFMPGLKEFVILVTVPGWVSPSTGKED